MQKTLLMVAAAAVTASLQAQHCTGAPPATSLSTVTPFTATHYTGSPSPVPTIYNGPMYFVDCVAEANVTITGIDCYLYDDGLVNVSQVGGTSTCTLYACLNTYAGNEIDLSGNGQPPAAWTLLGTGTLTVRASNDATDNHSHMVFSPPIVLPAGTWGLAVGTGVCNLGLGTPPGSLHPLITLQSAAPNIPLLADDQYLHISNQNNSRNAWVAGTGAIRNVNLQVNYTPDPTSGHSETFGAGCYSNPPAFYQTFHGAQTLNLSNTGFTMVPAGDHYVVVPGATAAYAPSTSPALPGLAGSTASVMGDDDVSAPQNLPFNFSFLGNPTVFTQVIPGSNGHMWLGGTSGGTFGYYDGTNGFLTGGARIAPAYGDWNPDPGPVAGTVPGTGSIHFDVDPNGHWATVSWDNVSEWIATGTISGFINCSVTLFDTGNIEFRYGNCVMGAQTAPVLVGFTPGATNVGDPGSRNIAGTMPFATGDGFLPPTLGLDRRPVLGRTIHIQTNLPTVPFRFDVLVLGFGEVPGIPLTTYFPGVPGCNLYVSPFAPLFTNGALSNAGTSSIPLGIPSSASYAGVTIYCQTGVLCGCQNAAGAVVSQAMCLKVGST